MPFPASSTGGSRALFIAGGVLGGLIGSLAGRRLGKAKGRLATIFALFVILTGLYIVVEGCRIRSSQAEGEKHAVRVRPVIAEGRALHEAMRLVERHRRHEIAE